MSVNVDENQSRLDKRVCTTERAWIADERFDHASGYIARPERLKEHIEILEIPNSE